MLLSRCWRWFVELMHFFQTHRPSSPPPPVELSNDVLFEIFLRLPPEVLPRFSILNKQLNDMINSPPFQTRYWRQKLGLRPKKKKKTEAWPPSPFRCCILST
ncbi:hypothetical protein RJT34_00599 [Clitoria ternatea]|uniref:F-box domain-containing protein n=1 Tax=Clitoria ternatea TaxID=43366 RepID=A0AAN9KGV9_CLITE